MTYRSERDRQDRAYRNFQMSEKAMPKRIPIAVAKRIAEEQGCSQVIVLAFDGELTHVVTYGKTLMDCAQAAEGGNRMKRVMGWPENLCNDKPSRVKRKESTP
jgi:hypothetical protein